MKSFNFKGKTLRVEIVQYISGGMGVELHTREGVYSRISVNLPESLYLSSVCFYAEHWSGQEELIQKMVELKIIKERTDLPPVESGFIKGIKAYEIADELKNVCSICESWATEKLTRCSCGYKFCNKCGSIEDKKCIVCLDPDNVIEDDEPDEDFDPDAYEGDSW